jgi:hypothetical protein
MSSLLPWWMFSLLMGWMAANFAAPAPVFNGLSTSLPFSRVTGVVHLSRSQGELKGQGYEPQRANQSLCTDISNKGSTLHG